MTGFDENTATAGRDRSFRRPARSARAAGDIHGGHGGIRLAAGVSFVSLIIVLAHFVHAVVRAPYYAPGAGPWPAWIALVVVGAIGGACIAAYSARLPDWLFAVLTAMLAVPVWLDLVAVDGLLVVGVTPTAAAAAGALLMPVAALRGTKAPLAIASVLSAILAAASLVQFGEAGRNTVVGLAIAATVVAPVVLITIAVRGFRRLVRREVDLSLVQSTVSTPRTAVGMRASEELAQLDFDAEALLEDVGAGRIAIPLPPDKAELAAALAARLRIRLIEGRTDTWLRHAVAESAYLSGRVEVDDPTGLAGRLSPPQREGLLFALWLIVGERSRRQPAYAAVRITPHEYDDDEIADLKVVIEASGVSRRHLDPTTWDAVGSLGTHHVAATADTLRIDVSCQTDPTSRAPSTAPSGARTRRA
ncbi:hypothetical protein ET445_15425 [Agromyces protaetiae]|uniref:Uncharacterized protein n=1 Tax=Agromyces protaetiae TaxID=2509455 RepID=A0A4V0YHF3_9MICO|nr:hypothetical protein [Agromyces protaetiae]QAY74511.1 hypothetical protein ET445_15425 [Agromyces protaetiae]